MAFNGSKREVMGEITLPICIRPTIFNITFQVMDIRLVYSCLLGKPWIHAAGVVPSSLHQKQLINVMGEKKLIINMPLPVEYIEEDEEALETSFQALDIVGTTNAKSEEGGPKPSRAVIMVGKVLISNGFQPDKGLGKELEGIDEPVTLQENPRKSGLSYIGTEKEGRSRWIQPNLYCHFTSKGTISLDQIAMIEGQLPRLAKWIREKAQRQKALVELQRLLEQEEPKFQSMIKDLEVVNLGGSKEEKEI
ncbi:hypothetical protein CR513_13974, partial [Mucuna pruriens]